MPEVIDELLAANAKPDEAPTHPKGWEPGVVWSPSKGGTVVTTGPEGSDVDAAFWAVVIADWGLDPATTEIVPDSVEIRAWDQQLGKGVIHRAKYYRARIRPRRNAHPKADADELARMLAKRKTRKPNTYTWGVGFVLNLADWQIGKGEGGGTAATVERISDAIDAQAQRLKDLRRLGRNVDTVAIVGLGDLVEQCSGHYPSQPFTTDCTRREQLRLSRLLIAYAVDTFADLAAHVMLGAVPGNHGENRQNGKMITTVDDSDDLAVFEQVGEALAQNPGRYDHVTVDLAAGLVLTADICGVTVGWTHMHQARGGGQKAIEDYWRGQVMGGHPLAAARILNTGHFHHLLISEATSRTVIQVPAMDGGSDWWTNATGQHSPPGMVSYLAGEGCGPRGWSDLVVL